MSSQSRYETFYADSVYSPHTVFCMTGISEYHQEEARQSGRLLLIGNGPDVRCSGHAVRLWLDAGCPFEPLPATTPTESKGTLMTYNNPIAVLENLIAERTKDGVPRDQARHAILKADPQLRQALLAEANANKSPQITAGIELIV